MTLARSEPTVRADCLHEQVSAYYARVGGTKDPDGSLNVGGREAYKGGVDEVTWRCVACGEPFIPRRDAKRVAAERYAGVPGSTLDMDLRLALANGGGQQAEQIRKGFEMQGLDWRTGQPLSHAKDLPTKPVIDVTPRR